MNTLEYLNKLYEKVKKKKLNKFWTLVDREDFKPIKGLMDSELDEKILKNIKYYSDKRIASIKIFIKNSEEYIKKNESLVHLVFGIWVITSDGRFRFTGRSLKVLYYKDDLENNKITLKVVQKFMKLCGEGILGSSVIGGIKFSKLMKTLENKNIKF